MFGLGNGNTQNQIINTIQDLEVQVCCLRNEIENGSVQTISFTTTAAAPLTITEGGTTANPVFNVAWATTSVANRVLASPVSGTGAVSLRALVATDIPALGGDPSASVGLTAVNGTATTYLRSDATPALDQGIIPIWTGIHTFGANPQIKNVLPNINFYETGGTALGFINFGTGASNIPSFISAITSDQLRFTVGNAADGTFTIGTSGQLGLGNPVQFGTTGQVLTSGGPTAAPSWTTPSAGVSAANPTAAVGTTAVNGVATTYMRSDAAPVIDLAMAPTWTGNHTYSNNVTVNGVLTAATFNVVTLSVTSVLNISANGAAPSLTNTGTQLGINTIKLYDSTQTTNGKYTELRRTGTSFQIVFHSDVGVQAGIPLSVSGLGSGVTGIASNSGSGQWIQTGDFVSTTSIMATSVSAAVTATSIGGPTNSGAVIGGSTNYGLIALYDSTQTADNRSADIINFQGKLQFRLKNDSGSSVVIPLAFSGGQALGITAIESNSGSGSWTHTGSFISTGSISTAANIVAYEGAITVPTNVSTQSSVQLFTGSGANQPSVTLVDKSRTANNRISFIQFGSGSAVFGFANDAYTTSAPYLQVTGGQAGGITAITSNSGSGAWTHTGAYRATGTISSGTSGTSVGQINIYGNTAGTASGTLTIQGPTGNSVSILVDNTITGDVGMVLRGTRNNTTVTGSYTFTATLDFPSTAAGTSSDLTIAASGAVLGDPVVVGVPFGSVLADTCYTAFVSATDVVTVRLNNYGTSAADPASGTFRIAILAY